MLGIDVQFNIISYAVVSTKYGTNSNLLESFLPLVEHALTCVDKNYIEEVGINDIYEEIYGYRIHSAILSQILKKLINQKKIVKLKYERIQINKTMLTTYDSKEEYEFKLRALISEMDMFLKRKGRTVKKDIITKSLINFLRKNAIEFNSFINYNSNFEEFEDDGLENNELIDFFIEERRNNTRHYEFIKDIYVGIVLSSMIIANEDVIDPNDEKFHVGNVLLDSNYIFRLLDLQTSLEFEAAQETYVALKENGCKFWVCKETIKQIADTLHAIISQCSETVHSILQIGSEKKFTGLASACLRRSLTPAQLEIIISQLEDILNNKFDVDFIDENEFDIDLIDVQSDDFWELQKIKPEASEFGISHDLLLIHIIAAKRSKTLYKAEKANWWILTDDNKLTSWNAKKHAVHGIPECITEAQLATVMWLCNPKKSSLDGLFNTVIALRSQGLAGNSEYIKISKEIDRQKERYSNDESKLRKLSLVLSQRVLSVEDFSSEDDDEIDEKFDQMLVDSKVQLEEKNRTIEEQEQKINKYEKNSQELLDKYEGTSSLLSEKTEKLIASLKIRKEDKECQREEVQKEIVVIEKQRDNQIKYACIIIKVLVVFVPAFFVWKMLPLIKSIETWYSKNQFLCLILTTIANYCLTFLGFSVEKLKTQFQLFVLKIVKVLSKIKILRDLEKEINILKGKSDTLFGEIQVLQDQIDTEIGN